MLWFYAYKPHSGYMKQGSHGLPVLVTEARKPCSGFQPDLVTDNGSHDLIFITTFFLVN